LTSNAAGSISRRERMINPTPVQDKVSKKMIG
jgi:hypothetical protein